MPRALVADPLGLGMAVSLDEALQAGLSRPQVRHRVTSGRWEPLGRGRYLRLSTLADITDEWERRDVRHAAMAASAGAAMPGSVVALGSAAVIHGLPLLTPPGWLELIAPQHGWSGVRRSVRLHSINLEPAESMPLPSRVGPPLVTEPEVRVTTPERTWLDLARSRPLADALAAGDAGMRAGAFTPASLEAAHQRIAGLPGCRFAARALPLLSALRESPFESASFAGFIDWGLPLPEMQVVIHDADGFVARVDFLWRDARVIGEADGALKYEHRGVLLAERRREQRLRELDYSVVRWTWDELMNEPWKVRLRLLQALRLAA